MFWILDSRVQLWYPEDMRPFILLFSKIRAGFSLLELSIVLVVLSLVISSGLTLTTEKTQQTQLEKTMDELEEIQTALRVYLGEYSKLPCPASITLTTGNALYGRSATDCADASPPAGLTRVEYPASSGKYVRIGGVPFYTLGLPERYLSDQYNNRYVYAVYETAITALSSSVAGNMQVLDTSAAAISSDAVVVLYSPGPSHKGAYAAKTATLISACNTTNKDGENCDADGVFTDATFNDGSVAASFFDDIILWSRTTNLYEAVATSSSASGFEPWAYENAVTSIYQQYPLEVKGVTTATFAGNAGKAAIDAACHSQYPNSWFARLNDFAYLSEIPVIASYARIHMNPATYGGTNVSIPTSNYKLYDGNGFSLDYMNCSNWTSSALTSSNDTVAIRRSSTAKNFRLEVLGSTTLEMAHYWHGYGGVAAVACNQSLPALCIGER